MGPLMSQADHEVAYELRKAFDKFVELRKELRSRGFYVGFAMEYSTSIITRPYTENPDVLEIKKTTTLTY
jgi:hypothetical protein